MNEIKDKKEKNNASIKLFRLGYFEIDYEDFLAITFKLVKFFTGLSVKMDLDSTKSLYIKIYVIEKNLKRLAEGFNYEMQLKPYAILYKKFEDAHLSKCSPNLKSKDNELNDLLNENEAITIISSFLSNNVQFHLSDQEDPSNFPPYIRYESSKFIKFRRYILYCLN